MSTDLTKRSRRLFGLIGAGSLAAAAILSYLGVRGGHPGSTYLTATFDQSAQGLDDQSDVKIRGINVGGVSKVTLTADGRVRVRIRLNQGIRAPESSTAVIEPLSIFGPKYIDLEPGAGEGTGPYLADGAAFRRTQGLQDLTDIATPTYQLLGAVDPGDLTKIVHSFAEGLDGRGASLSQTIDDAARLLDLSDHDAARLKSLIGNAQALSQTFGTRGDEAVRLARNLNTIGPAIVGDPAQFTAILLGAGKLSDQLLTLLRTDPGAPRRVIDSVAPALAASYKYRANTPQLITGVGSFFSQTSGILQVDGPHGTLLGTETVHMSLSDPICTFILGLCRPYPQPLPYPGGK